MLPLVPSIDGESRRVVKIGRAYQPQWFEAVLLDMSDLNCISREACELSWGGQNPAQAHLTLRTVGNGLVIVDEAAVARGEVALLHPGSRITFASQGECCRIITLAVHCAAVLPPGPRTVAIPVPLEQAPPAAQEGAWRLVCIFAQGLAPEEFWALPEAVRSMPFLLPKGSPAQFLGRQYQPEVFEILVREPGMLSSISRSHFRLEAADDGVLVTNLSQNVAVVAQRPLHHGESVEVLDGDTLSFAHMVPKGAEASGLGAPSGPDCPLQPTPTRDLDTEHGDVEVTIVPFLTLRLVGPPPPAPASNFIMDPPTMATVPTTAVLVPVDLVELPPVSVNLPETPPMESDFSLVASEASPVVPAATSPAMLRRVERPGGAPLVKAPAASQRHARGLLGSCSGEAHFSPSGNGDGLVQASTAPLARASATAAEPDQCEVM